MVSIVVVVNGSGNIVDVDAAVIDDAAAVTVGLLILLLNESGDGDGDAKPVTICVVANNLNTTAATTRRNRFLI